MTIEDIKKQRAEKEGWNTQSVSTPTPISTPESVWSKACKTAQEIQWFNILFTIILIVSIFILVKKNFIAVKSFLLEKHYANKRLIILIIFVLIMLASSVLLNSNLEIKRRLSCSVSKFFIQNDRFDCIFMLYWINYL